jgi:hypothetical protein
LALLPSHVVELLHFLGRERSIVNTRIIYFSSRRKASGTACETAHGN